MAELSIDTNSIKPNSYKYKEEQAKKSSGKNMEERDKLSPVVKKGGVVSTKKPLGQKFAEVFMSEDTEDIKSYILMDVIIPGIKNTVLDVMEMAFFGSISGSKKRGRSHKDDRTDYRSYYGSSSDFRRSERRDRERDRDRRGNDLDYRNIVLLNRDETEEVINQLHKRIEKYGAVSIAELFDLIDEPSNYNDNNWGWDDERDIRIRRVSRGYLIDVAKAKYLD